MAQDLLTYIAIATAANDKYITLSIYLSFNNYVRTNYISSLCLSNT